MEKTNILGVDYAVTDTDRATEALLDNLALWRGEYLCAGNVHTTVMAHDDPVFRAAENGAVMVLPDGKPISIVQRRWGFPQAGQAAGPDFMGAVFQATAGKGIRHYFYGSRRETLDAMIRNLSVQYPGLTVAGSEPSVFREMSEEENRALVLRINACKPDILWVGLGAPRQELFMAGNKGRFACVSVGVGGGFDCFAGNVKRAPRWMQRLCLEWLFRLLQEPRRLFKRYLITNTRFLYLLAKHEK